MIRLGLDANVVLRALLNDDPRQPVVARGLLSGLGEERRAYLGISALLEMFWVLRSRYRVPREELYGTIRDLLMTKHLDIESPDAVVRALSQYRKGRVDFPDALLAERSIDAGCEFTHTFDGDAATLLPSVEFLR